MKLSTGGRIQLLAAIFGDFIEVEIPLSRFTAEDAIELAQALTVHAHLLREREIRPENRRLPLSEEFALSLSDSFAGANNQTPTSHGVGVTALEVSA